MTGAELEARLLDLSKAMREAREAGRAADAARFARMWRVCKAQLDRRLVQSDLVADGDLPMFGGGLR